MVDKEGPVSLADKEESIVTPYVWVEAGTGNLYGIKIRQIEKEDLGLRLFTLFRTYVCCIMKVLCPWQTQEGPM